MDISKVSLNDPATTWLDAKSKSIGYFSKRDQTRVDLRLVEEIKTIASDTGENVRLSLHHNRYAEFHEMIIFQHKHHYYRPKKHVTKAKSFHMIEGTMVIFVFDDNGVVLDTCILDGINTIAYRVEANIFHTDIPITDYVVHHESTLGPFMGDEDRIFAPWSPDGEDKREYLSFRDSLLGSIENI